MSPEELEDFQDEVDQVHAYYRDEVILAAATEIMQERGLVTVELKTQNGFTQCAVNDYLDVFGLHRKEGEPISLYSLPLQVKK